MHNQKTNTCWHETELENNDSLEAGVHNTINKPLQQVREK